MGFGSSNRIIYVFRIWTCRSRVFDVDCFLKDRKKPWLILGNRCTGFALYRHNDRFKEGQFTEPIFYAAYYDNTIFGSTVFVRSFGGRGGRLDDPARPRWQRKNTDV